MTSHAQGASAVIMEIPELATMHTLFSVAPRAFVNFKKMNRTHPIAQSITRLYTHLLRLFSFGSFTSFSLLGPIGIYAMHIRIVNQMKAKGKTYN